MLVHPDHNSEANAKDVFNALNDLVGLATKSIIEGNYGKNKKIKVTKIESKKDTYEIGPRSWTGVNSIVFRGTNKDNRPITLKLAKDVSNNKAILNTVKVLTKLHADKITIGKPVIPQLLDNFSITVDGKKQEALVYDDEPRGELPSLTLTKIIDYYPNGVAPAHFVWMMKRILGAILATEEAKVVHGAILPCHIIVHPDSHLEKLVGWSHTVDFGQTGKQIIEKYKDYYPANYLTSKLSSTTDIHMLAKCMIKVLGGDVISNEMPDTVPLILQGYLRSLVVGTTQTSASIVFHKLVALAKQVFGDPKFIQLNIPT